MADSDILILPRRKPEAPKVEAEDAEIVAPAAPVIVAVPVEQRDPSPEPPPSQPAPAQVDLDAVKAALLTLASPAATGGAIGERSVDADTRVDVTARVGVLLVNLGTPEAADAKAVRAYLREFLTDRRVIEQDGALWRMVLKGIILPFRPRVKARAYRKIWNQEANESPLKTITRAQAEKLAASLAQVDHSIAVDWAMRYGHPSIPSRLEAMAARGCERILLMPLYPQYSAASTATACDMAFRTLMTMRNQPSLRVAPPYYADPIYVDALADSVRDHIRDLPSPPDMVLASYHGMPLDYILKGDPYERHCNETTRLLREALNMDETRLQMSYQSRFGRAKWLEPATDKTVKKLAKSGVKSLAVVMPGFAADCLETLEEIAMEVAHVFKKAGGERFSVVPCLNDSVRGMTVIEQAAMRELRGWI